MRTDFVVRHVAAALTGCVLLAAGPGSVRASETDLYLIGAEDVLKVSVWDEPDLTGQFNVEGDGSFTFPMIGRVHAVGLSVRQVEQTIADRLEAGYLRNPQVSVSVETYGSQRIFVMGEVAQPGMYTLRGRMLVMEALARAGATTELAATEAFIIPNDDTEAGNPTAAGDSTALAAVLPGHVSDTTGLARIDLEALQRGDLSYNVPLRDGDTLFVPKASTVFVSGNVNSPGAYPIERDTTVGEAVILAGGVDERGSTSRLRVVRSIDGEKREFRASEHDLLADGDTVVVLQRLF